MSFEVKFILHSKRNEKKISGILKLFDEKIKIDNNNDIITFQIPKEQFDKFQTSLPTKFSFFNNDMTLVQKYKLNLIKGNNTYHIFDGGYCYSFELLFYGEETLKIIAENDIIIDDFDKCSKFQRCSLINLNNTKIKVNDAEIDLLKFLPLKKSKKSNSYHYSFYDISKKYIISKEINIIQKLNMEKYYNKNSYLFKKCSNDISNYSLELQKNPKTKFDISQLKQLIPKYQNQFSDIIDLNLNLPCEKLNQLLNKEKYLDFFYHISKLEMLLVLLKCKDINRENFLDLLEYLETTYKQLLSNNNLLEYEKILLLLNYTGLFNDIQSCEKFKNIYFHYIKIAQAEENSPVKLAKNFLDNFVENLNEESPSYFNLIEINSDYGFFEKNKMFLFDMISLEDLKIHLHSSIPTVFGLFSLEESSIYAVTNSISGAISINEKKLFENTERIDIGKNILKEKECQSKNIAMRISEELMHECFGHKKFQFHSNFCNKPKCSTPFKCIDIKSKKKRKIVGEMNYKNKNNINILSNPEKSDSGNYFESSFGKLSGTNFFTFTLLKRIKNQDKLLDNPLLFTEKDNLKKLQKYSYYKFKYEIQNEKIDELKKCLTFEEEYNYLVNIYENSKAKQKEDLGKNIIEEKEEKNKDSKMIEEEGEEEKEEKNKKKKDMNQKIKQGNKYLSKKRKRGNTIKKDENKPNKITLDNLTIKRFKKTFIKRKIGKTGKEHKKKIYISKKFIGNKIFDILLDDDIPNEIQIKYLEKYLENLSRI